MSELTDMAENIARFSKSGVPIVQKRAVAYPQLGISGYAGSGKTEVAKFIVERFGYERHHIAEPLRRMLASLLREYGFSERNIDRMLTGDLKDDYVIPMLGVTSRHLQVTLGMEWGREQISQNLWANLWSYQAAERKRSGGPASLNDSVRFPNEQDAIRAGGGWTILVTRPGTGPAVFKWKRIGPLLYRWFGCMWGVHDSERIDRLKPDFVIVNDGTIADLHEKVAELVGLAPYLSRP